MRRPTTRTALLPAALLLSALAACAGSPTGPSARTLRHDGTTTPPADTVKSKPSGYENPVI